MFKDDVFPSRVRVRRMCAFVVRVVVLRASHASRACAQQYLTKHLHETLQRHPNFDSDLGLSLRETIEALDARLAKNTSDSSGACATVLPSIARAGAHATPALMPSCRTVLSRQPTGSRCCMQVALLRGRHLVIANLGLRSHLC